MADIGRYLPVGIVQQGTVLDCNHLLVSIAIGWRFGVQSAHQQSEQGDSLANRKYTMDENKELSLPKIRAREGAW